MYDKEGNYKDVMDISLVNCRKSHKVKRSGSNGKAPRSPDMKNKKRLEKLQKEVKEMRAWEDKIVTQKELTGKKMQEIQKLKNEKEEQR